MAMSNQNGVAEGSVPGLATFARVSIEDCERALSELMAPDTYSRSKEHEGRRIEAVEGGWRILNHRKYREKMSADERREYLRKKQAEWRARHKPSVNTASTDVDRLSTVSTHTEADTDTDTKDQLIDQDNQQQLAAVVDKTTAEVKGRKRKPYVTRERFVVHDWMHADLRARLGKDADAFDLETWYAELDRKISGNGAMDTEWPWLRKQCLREARERGLILDSANNMQARVAKTRPMPPAIQGRTSCQHDPPCANTRECTKRTINEHRKASGREALA